MDLAQPPPRAVMMQSQQQRPSLSYFVFLSILFFIINSNGNNENVIGGNASEEGKTAFARMKYSLAMREGKREGLARWLGMGNATWEADHGGMKLPNGTWVRKPTNGTKVEQEMTKLDYAEVIPFRPASILPDSLSAEVHQLKGRRIDRAVLYHQNLTGFVRGEWHAEPAWTFEKLGLAETWNTTQLRAEVVEIFAPSLGDEQSPRVEDNPASPAVKLISRRQLGEDQNATLPTPPSMVNHTTTHNRTLLRASYPFSAGGKVSFNLREEQTSAAGALKPLGKSRGDEKLLELDESAMNETWMQQGLVTYLKGDITLSSSKTFEDLVLDIEGVHLLSQGTVYAYLTPSFVRSHLFDAVALPFIHSPELVDAAENLTAQAVGHVMLKEVDRRLLEDRQEVSSGVIRRDNDLPEVDVPRCIFAMYGSLAPLPPSYSSAAYSEWYSSLFMPTGSSLRAPPPAILSYTLYSPNCGLVLQGEAEGLMTVSLWERALGYAGLMALTQALIVWVLVRQMERAGPGSSSKIAYTTIAVQAAMDSYFSIIQFTVGVVTSNRSSLPCLVPAFLALISSLVFGMRYAAQVRAAAPPPVRRVPAPAPVAPPPPPPPTQQELQAAAAERRARAATDGEGEAEETEPLVAPVPAAAPSVAPRPVVEEESDLPYILGGLAVAVCAGTLVIVWGWMSLILLLIYSYWIPQIVLNVQRGAARQTLRREYVIGTTMARLGLPTYFWAYKGNVLAVEPSLWIYALIAYSSAQASILIMQDSRFGARFFLPRPLLSRMDLAETETWDYHPLLPPPDLEAGALGNEEGNAKEDCPICLSPIQIAPARSGAAVKEKDAGEIDREKERQELRWGYMIPPCGHVAHTECLESWIEIKSVCPSCRARLPPL